MFRMWAENVDRFCEIDCSSPMSLRILETIISSLSADAGIGIIDWVISVSRPIVFSVTVFPPVFGPVITTIRESLPRESEIGTAPSIGRSG